MWGDNTAGEGKGETHTGSGTDAMCGGRWQKGNKGAELAVAMFQYFGTAFALYLLNPLWVNERQRLVFMSTDTVVEQLTDCLPQFIRSLLVSYQYCTVCTYLHEMQWVQGSKSVKNKCIQLADHSRLILVWVFLNFCFEALFFFCSLVARHKYCTKVTWWDMVESSVKSYSK